MAKIDLDKYYTPRTLAKQCYDTALSILGKENITEIIEPSAGDGAFLDCSPRIIGYDLAPEREDIIKADFLTLNFNYLEGRLFIGNPPFGERLNLARQFYKKCVQAGDYIAFILPISQLGNSNSLYEFDLVHSEDLGKHAYSNITLHCVFNIYKRPDNKILNPKPVHNLKGIEICRSDSKKYLDFPYDVRMCVWGNSTAGKVLSEGESYSSEIKIKISEALINKEDIVKFIKTYDWNSHVANTSMKKIQKHHIINEIRKRYYPQKGESR